MKVPATLLDGLLTYALPRGHVIEIGSAEAQIDGYRRPFGVAISAPARMVMGVGTGAGVPSRSSAKARGCSVPRPGTLLNNQKDHGGKSTATRRLPIEHGNVALADPPGGIVENETPARYVPEVVASLLPKDLNLSVTKYDDLTDEQLIMRLRLLTQQAAPLIGRLIDQGQGDELAPVI